MLQTVQAQLTGTRTSTEKKTLERVHRRQEFSIKGAASRVQSQPSASENVRTGSQTPSASTASTLSGTPAALAETPAQSVGAPKLTPQEIMARTRAKLARLKRAYRDDDQLADIQYESGVDGTVAQLRGR